MLLLTPSLARLSFTNNKSPVGIVQRYIQQIHEMGIKRIICVSHNGYIDDKYLAENTRGISLIVGGHSHTYLADSNSSTAAGATIDGTYPSAVTNLDGHTTYVVQAHRFGDYLGRVEIEFNDEDELVSLAGQPILLDQSVAMDPLVAKEVTDLKIMFQDKTREVVAHLTNTLDFLPCRQEECMLANLVFGSMLDYAKSIDSNHSIAFSNTGGLRAGLQRGNVTVADIIDLLPFGHTLISFEMLGSEIMK